MSTHTNPPDTSISTSEAIKQFLSLPKHQYFEWCLKASFPPLSLLSTTQEIQKFIQFDCGRKDKQGNTRITEGGRHGYYRIIRCFFNWAYSPASGLGLAPAKNPVTWVVAPKVPKRKMPAQNERTIEILLSLARNTRDKAIISTFIDSSGRRAEVANIRELDIVWDKHAIKAMCKGAREAFLPIGPRTETLIKSWLSEYRPPADGNIWGMTVNGIVTMLRRLEKHAGFKCNAHTFRRGFACIQRRNKVDTLDIKTLGHWKSARMVERYTEDVDFEDAQRHYIAPSSNTPPSEFNNRILAEMQPPQSLDIVIKLAEELGAAKERIKQLETELLLVQVKGV